MDAAELEDLLAASPDNEVWVIHLATFLAGHELCYGHGTTNPYDEAYWLLRHLQEWSEARWSAAADPALAAVAAALAVRRAHERRPLAYLLNEAWCAGLRFFVDERVLVPRSPLAELIERRFAPWIVLRAGDRVLDVGTGSGCLAIATALHCDDVVVDATDVSAGALEVAAVNVARHAVAARVQLHRGDLFPSGERGYRVIIANPPYVPEREYAGLPPEYLREPRVGLVGGNEGIELAARLLTAAVTRLAPDGALFLEVGRSADALAARFPRLELTWLELERGGEGVCHVAARDLARALGRGSDDE